MTHSSSQKRKRHIPQRNATHVYWSERSDGSKVFEVRHPRDAEGKRLYEVVGTRLDEAKKRAREVYGDDAPRVTSVGLTLSDVVASWRETRQLRPQTAISYDANVKNYIQKRFGRTKVREIDKNAIVAWVNGLKRKDGKPGPLASGTRRQILATMSVILDHAVELGALGTNPVKQIRNGQRPRPSPARRRILTPDEERRVLAYSAAFPRLRPIILVALHQALRLGEVLGLQWEDVDFAAGKLHVRHSLSRSRELGPPKGGKPATIDLTPVARETLLELRLDGADGLVFRNGQGGARQHRDAQRAFEKAVERAALPVTDDGPVVFHSLRHTAISRLANHPAIPLVHVRDFARHADLATTQGYVHKIASEAITTAIAEALVGREE